jgi:chemotaxis family two-component system response regulator Rcp1
MFKPAAIEPIDILLVEDNAADVRLTLEALKESQLNTRLHVVRDGFAAMALLRREGNYASAPRPRLILLDLNLPGRDGREILADLKGDEDLRRIPVVILTTSRAEEDILRSYDLQANCYITKPFGMEAFMNVVLSIERFWFTIATLPPE